MTPEGPDKGSAVTRALAVLEAVAGAEQAVSPAELQRQLGLPKATIHRLCQTLERSRFLERDLDGKRLTSGPRFRALAFSHLASDRERANRHLVLRTVSEKIGETCNIALPDGDEMVYLDRVETHWPLRHQLPVGTRVPLYCTASGKLYLSSLSSDRRRRLLGRIALERQAPNTVTDPDALEAALRIIRRTEIGTDDQEFIDGMVAVAVPVKDQLGRLSATLAFHAPEPRMSFEDALEHVETLREAAAELTAMMIGPSNDQVGG